MDVVSRLGSGEISEDEADELFGQLLDAWHGDEYDLDGFAAHMGVTKREYTTILHGASLLEIAQLRLLGFPSRCASCGTAIDYDDGYWFHPSDIEGELGWVGCITCAGHPAQDVVPRPTE